MPANVRIEHDLLGDLAVPADAYYGVGTARALDNVRISDAELRLYPNLIEGLAMVKLAAVRANHELGALEAQVVAGIDAACQELIDGKLHDQFRLDVLQGGAGTSTNVNVNEVIANRALELMGHEKGEYTYCSPDEHVNRSQSSSDVYLASIQVGLAFGNREIIRAWKELIAAFGMKGEEFGAILKMGRTELQDAAPMSLGQEFHAFAQTLEDEIVALEHVEKALYQVSIGGASIGAGLNTPAAYASMCTKHLAAITGMPIRLARNLVEATQDTQAFVLYSSVMKSLAIKLAKVGNDLRLLSSGPRCGLHEISLPATNPGSSMTPGNVSPVIPEVTNMVAYRVIGNDLVVTLAAEAGQLQLNAFEPLIAAVLFESQTLFINAADALRVHCINGITANEDVCRRHLETSIGTLTALNSVIGAEKAIELAAEAFESGDGVLEIIRGKQILTDTQIDEILTPAALTGQGR